jgi:2-methylcitrate dehydratase PrpD
MSDPQIAKLRTKVVMQELPEVRAWPYDRPARVTIKLNNGKELSAFCEAALGSSARPLDSEAVLNKIKFLSIDLAPNLYDAVVHLRHLIDQEQLNSLSTSEWVNSIF